MRKNTVNNLTVIIPTRSEDVRLAQKALNSINWVDSILIADSSVTKKGADRVRRFAKKNKAQYIHREYRYSADFKNWAIPQAKDDWIFLLDSDEIVTAKLKRHIQQLFLSGRVGDFDGYAIARKHFFFGKFLRFGGRYPLYNVRLFKRKCRYEDRDVHAHIIIPQDRLRKILPKEGDILHYSDRNIEQFFERFARYSDYQARYIQKVAHNNKKIDWGELLKGNFLYTKAMIKDIWFFIPGHSLWRFIWMYVFKLGFLDGWAGLTIAVLYGFQDYVSKTKYYLLKKEKVDWRRKFQNVFVYLVASLFGRQKKEFIKQFHRHLPTTRKQIRAIIQAKYV